MPLPPPDLDVLDVRGSSVPATSRSNCSLATRRERPSSTSQ